MIGIFQLSSKTSFVDYDEVTGILTVTLRDEDGKEPNNGWFNVHVCAIADATAQPYATADASPPILIDPPMRFGANRFRLSDTGTGSALNIEFLDWADNSPWPIFSDLDNPGAFSSPTEFHARIGFVCADGVLVSEMLTIAVTA